MRDIFIELPPSDARPDRSSKKSLPTTKPDSVKTITASMRRCPFRIEPSGYERNSSLSECFLAGTAQSNQMRNQCRRHQERGEQAQRKLTHEPAAHIAGQDTDWACRSKDAKDFMASTRSRDPGKFQAMNDCF